MKKLPFAPCEVGCPDCDEVFVIDGNSYAEIECPECGFKGDQTDFYDADALESEE